MPLGTKKVVLTDLDGVFFPLVDHFGEYGVAARFEEEVSIVDGLGDTLDLLMAKGFAIVGITNQPDIAREKITPAFLKQKHRLLQATYPQIGEIFVCAHTDTDLCLCRKPKPGLLMEAGKKYGANFAKSWMIGDSRSDIEAGHAMHARTMLIQTPWNSAATVPVLSYVTAVAKDIGGALRLILALEEESPNKHDV